MLFNNINGNFYLCGWQRFIYDMLFFGGLGENLIVGVSYYIDLGHNLVGLVHSDLG